MQLVQLAPADPELWCEQQKSKKPAAIGQALANLG